MELDTAVRTIPFADDLEDTMLERALHAVRVGAVRTPVLDAPSLTERIGGRILLKAENLQRTGSFKIRGALARVGMLGSVPGVVAGSAGNHAQGVALAARTAGIPCEVFMPVGAPVSKVEATAAAGAVVHLTGEHVEDAVQAAQERAEATGACFVHPFDDPVVVHGQATLGVELLEQVDDLALLIIPVGGGGLAAGVAAAVRRVRPEVRVVGVQSGACAPLAASLIAGRPERVVGRPTIADGIAVQEPGAVTLPLIARWVDRVVAVDEDAIAEAMVVLLEEGKLLVEGAGAVGVAALLAGAVRPAEQGSTVVVLSGGNVDAGLLSTLTRRRETGAGRRSVLFTRVPDSPGSLARLLAAVGGAGANVVDIVHLREGVDLGVRESGIQLVLETRSAVHARQVIERARADGYVLRSTPGAAAAVLR